MITEKELLEAIAECHGVRNPNANTCAKLASYYTILDHMTEDPADFQPAKNSYSFASKISTNGASEFSQAIQGMEIEDLVSLMDELMTTLQIVNPRLYAGVMRKLEG